MPVADRTTFVELYAGQPRWEIGRPQKALLDVADRITGSVLDCGCGSGENALFLAGRGQKVTGIDFLAEPVKWARQKVDERGLAATFLVMDALALKALPEVFDSAIDSGLFHVFSDEDRRQEIEDAFTEGWVVESIEPTRYEVRPDPNDASFRDGGPRAWFVVVRKL